MPADGGAAAGESEAFLKYVNATFPATADHWVGYGSESEFLDIVGDPDYNRDPSDTLPAFAAGVVFTSGSPDWEYTVGAVGMMQPSLGGKGGGNLAFCTLSLWHKMRYPLVLPSCRDPTFHPWVIICTLSWWHAPPYFCPLPDATPNGNG